MQKIQTNDELIFGIFHTLNRPLKRSEIFQELEGKVAKSAIDRWLKDASAKGIAVKTQYGSYSLKELCQNEKTELEAETKNLFNNNT